MEDGYFRRASELRHLKPPGQWDEDDTALFNASISYLEELGGQSCLLVDKQGKLQQRWRTHSLLATFAAMAIQDLANDAVHSCDECGRLFVSTAYQAKFCSALCRRRVHMREYMRERAKKKAARNKTRSRRKRTSK